MTADEKTRFWYRLLYRIFVGLTCIAVGFLFYYIPIANIEKAIVKGGIEGVEFDFTLPVLFVVVGMGILMGLFDWCLSHALRFKKAYKKAKQ